MSRPRTDGRLQLALKSLVFTVLVPGTAAVFVPLLIARGRPIAAHPVPLAAGLALVSLGAGMYAWCLWDFATVGRGTPLPLDAPRRLVALGLYRLTRNPMYLGVLAVIGGWACLFASGWLLVYAGSVALAFHLFIVLYEEPHLQALFGAEYTAYCRAVPRWLPRPRVKPSR